jgi:hypothetical protein
MIRALIMSLAVVMWAQTAANFAANFFGTWKQSNERCIPKRTGDVTLRIDHRYPRLTVETTILRGSAPARHAVQSYSTDGKVSVSTGADGDEFHTSVSWRGPSLVFAVEEHEDGRILPSTETWTLIENGTVLQRVRQRSDSSSETQIYLR